MGRSVKAYHFMATSEEQIGWVAMMASLKSFSPRIDL